MSMWYGGARSVWRHERCLNGVNCTGPGCRVSTGKTARKQNFGRSHPNKRNVGDAPKGPKVKVDRR